MAWIKVYFLYVPSQRSCIGSILKSAMLVMLVKSSLRCSWQQASKQIGDREEEKKVKPFAPASQLRKVKGQQTWSNIVKFTGSRGDVFAVRTSKPLKKCDTFHYSFYIPQLRDWGLARSAYSTSCLNFVPSFEPLSPGRRAVRQRGYDLRLLIFKMANNKVDLGQIRSEKIVYNRFIKIPLG